MSKPGITAVPDPSSSSSSKGAFEELIGILGREFELGREELEPDSHLVDDLDLDSLDFVALAAAIEEEWDCTLEPEQVAKASTIQDLVAVLEGIRA